VLAAADVRAHELAPAQEPAGCIFRGAKGCTLKPEHRPTMCLRYLCAAAQRELHAQGLLDEVERLAERLSASVEGLESAKVRSIEKEALLWRI
jgi:hypothetical protein